ncbi:ATP synthase F1 subunit delta, partial [Enterobacter hormaechei]|nr:ATP synthase F1 subunit delta [Enterobacter hormaechei]
QNMLAFIAEVTRNEQVGELLSGSLAPETLAKTFITLCGEQVDEHAQNFIRVMAENGRLLVLPEVFQQFIQLRASLESTIDVEVISASELNEQQ